jgi:hypothetical protein
LASSSLSEDELSDDMDDFRRADHKTKDEAGKSAGTRLTSRLRHVIVVLLV